MSKFFVTYGGMISPLGTTIEEHAEQLTSGVSGVTIVEKSGFNQENWPLGKILFATPENRFDYLLELLCDRLVEQHGSTLFSSDKTLIVISSTKADIDGLPNDTFASTRDIIQNKLAPKHSPIIISNACISGVLAINTAADYLSTDKYDDIVVIGIDALSDFVVFGFQSLFALSDSPSQPFDKNRKGICIGEAAAAVIVSKQKLPTAPFSVLYCGGSSSNDANHISGPSRTGEGLFRSVNKTIERSGVNPTTIDYISAHGTGTLYNDEMESIAFDRLGMTHIPLNSYKGYFGHTLGAAGIIEIMASMITMEKNILFKSIGFEETGTSCPLNVITETKSHPVNTILKTASGFGGGNASLILTKEL